MEARRPFGRQSQNASAEGTGDVLVSNIPQAPAWLIEKAKAARTEAPLALPHVDLDTPDNIKRAIEYLTKSAPEAISGAGGNDTTYRVASRVKDFGISQEQCVELLRDHWNEERAIPSWDLDDLERIANNAYRYGSSAPGSSSAEADFNVVDLTEILREKALLKAGKPANNSALYYIHATEAVARSATSGNEPLIKGFLDCAAMSVLYGESNTGKTFVALDVCAHIGTGKPWHGRKTTHGLVVYIAAEGSRGVYKRIDAWCRKHSVDPKQLKLALVPCPIDLRSDTGSLKPLIELIRKAEADYGEPVVMVVVDTLSRALAGGDENSSVDMGAFVKNCDRLRFAVKAHLLVIHHSGKNKAAGARGWSGVRGAVDTEIEIADRTIEVTKQRDLEPIDKVRFKLESLTLYKDADGDAVTSATVVLLSGSEFVKAELVPEEARWLESIEAALLDADKTIVDPFDWKFAAEAAGGDSGDNWRGRAQRMLEALTEKGYLKKPGRGKWTIVE
jgi:hypothetical protein